MLRSGPLTRGDDDDPAIRTFPALASRPSISATWRRRQPSVTFRAAALAASTPSPAASAPHAWEAAGGRRSGGRAAPRALRPGPARPGPSAGPPQGGRSKPPREPAAGDGFAASAGSAVGRCLRSGEAGRQPQRGGRRGDGLASPSGLLLPPAEKASPPPGRPLGKRTPRRFGASSAGLPAPGDRGGGGQAKLAAPSA